MVPQAQRGTVMQVVAITPESIQLSLKARTASSAVTPNSASAAAMPSDCIRPIKSTYSPSTMSGESSEKKTFALSRKNTFKLRMVERTECRGHTVSPFNDLPVTVRNTSSIDP